MDNIPVIRLTLSGMKHEVIHAFTQYELDLAEDIKVAVEEYCKPDNIQRVVNEEVRRVLDDVIREDVQAFYRYGEGRRAVGAAVSERLKAD